MHSSLRAVGRAIQSIVLLPFAIVIAVPVVLFFGVAFTVHLPGMIWSNHKWKSLLKRQGRFCNPRNIGHELRRGTLIVDSHTLGWRRSRCWWTPEDIRSIAPHSIPTGDDRKKHIQAKPDKLEMPFDAWIYEHYLHPDHGRAILLATRRGDRYANRLELACPALNVVNSWSAPVVLSSEQSQSDATDG